MWIEEVRVEIYIAIKIYLIAKSLIRKEVKCI